MPGRGVEKHELGHASRYNRYDEHELPGWFRVLLVLGLAGVVGVLAWSALRFQPPTDLERVGALAVPFIAMVVLGLVRAEKSG